MLNFYGYYFYMNKNIQGDLQISISVPLSNGQACVNLSWLNIIRASCFCFPSSFLSSALLLLSDEIFAQ